MKSSKPVKFPAAIFDLDGTLADTLKDLADATNWGLTQLKQPTYPVEGYKVLVGAGRTELCRRALAADRQALVPDLVALMTEYYSKHCFDYTRPYPGIPAVLEKLSGLGIRLAVLSNKPQNFVELTMARLFGNLRFAAVMGDVDGLPRKPDPAGALQIAESLGLSAADFAYVGDTSIDMETANRAGMYAIGVSWGFREREELIRSGAKVIVDTAEDLYRAIDGAKD